MEIVGKIAKVLEVQSGVSQRTGTSWKSQDYVLEYFWWPNQTVATKMAFQVFGEERIKNFDLHENDEVKVFYHIEANEYNGRYYNKVICTNIEKIGASNHQNTGSSVTPSANNSDTPSASNSGTLAADTDKSAASTPAEAEAEADGLPF